MVLTLHVDKHNTWTYFFCLFISSSCTSHSPTYWVCLTELRGALSNCTFSDLEVRCLPCGCLCCLLLRYFLMSVCELIFNKSLLLCGFYVGFRLYRYSYWNDRVTFWVISLQASFIVHRFWTSFCIRSLCAFTSQRFWRLWIPNILEFTQETLLSCCLLCFYPALGPSPAPGSYLWADHVTFHRQEHTAWLPIFFHWGTTELQCVSFRYTSKWFSVCLCILFFQFFSIIGYYKILIIVPCVIQ